MKIQDCIKFTNDNPFCYLATVENDQLRVRAMKRVAFYLFAALMVVLFFSCEKDEPDNEEYSFNLEGKYDSIRSCPGGGGIFILKVNNTGNQTERINLELQCDRKLNASLSRNHVDSDQSVFEVLINPANTVSISDFNIKVIGERKGHTDSLNLYVSVIDWENTSELGETAETKKTTFVNWLNTDYPDIDITDQTDWDIYTTYPQILIVEHYTLLSEKYELRICCHVMIPPYDWSMIRIRERNSFEAFFAAKLDSTNGPVYQIPVEDYPSLFGY
ncbi:MAG: hypothetical protein V2A67_10600 [Bacteroidota bacterium]